MHKFLNKFFGPVEEINGNRCPTSLYRWKIIGIKQYKLYIHHFVGDDWSINLHDHPRRFISIGIYGWYYEDTPNGTKKYTAPWFRSFPAEHKHRIRVPSKNCWTLAIVLKITRQWGFLV